nr:hypothetical protein [Micromonospora carbonacea]
MVARVIRVRDDLVTYDGWCWLDVYQLDARGGEYVTTVTHLAAGAAAPSFSVRPLARTRRASGARYGYPGSSTGPARSDQR